MEKRFFHSSELVAFPHEKNFLGSSSHFLVLDGILTTFCYIDTTFFEGTMKNLRRYYIKNYALFLVLGACSQAVTVHAATKNDANTPEFELNYGINKGLDLQTSMKAVELNTLGRPALKAVNRYETALGINLKPAQWLKLQPEVRYQWTETNGVFDTELSGRQVQFGIDAIVNF